MAFSEASIRRVMDENGVERETAVEILENDAQKATYIVEVDGRRFWARTFTRQQAAEYLSKDLGREIDAADLSIYAPNPRLADL